MLAFALQLVEMEQVKMKILLERREDGHTRASIFLGNATRETITNLSLELDVDTVVENPQKLVGARGFVRETKSNSIIEFSTFNEISKDKEIKGLWTFFCHENGEEGPNIISRNEWGAKQQVVRQEREKPADFLVVDGQWYNEITSNYFARMQIIESYQVKNYGNLWANFWISDDGNLFEGIGWDNYNYFNKAGFGPEFFNVGFMKRKTDAAPSKEAIKAFRRLVKAAICTKRLSLHYSMIPYYLFYDYLSLRSNSFEMNEMRKWDRYVENVDFLFPVESDETWKLPIVSRFEWSDTEPKAGLMAIPSPIEHLVVKQFGGRCITNCSNHLKTVERAITERYGEKSNFFVAEDGRAYEAEGWDRTWDVNYQEKKAVEITFLGCYFNYRPHKRIFSALKGLINEGLRLGKLSHNYSIVSKKTANPSLPWEWNYPKEEIMKLDRYTEKF